MYIYIYINTYIYIYIHSIKQTVVFVVFFAFCFPGDLWEASKDSNDLKEAETEVEDTGNFARNSSMESSQGFSLVDTLPKKLTYC